MPEGFQRPAPPPDGVFSIDHPCRMVKEHITSRWGLLILTALQDGPLRFFELRDRIGGITEKMLSQTLRTLTRDGLVERTVEPSVPPRVSYALTDLGWSLAQELQRLMNWIGAHTGDVVDAQRRHDAEHGLTGS